MLLTDPRAWERLLAALNGEEIICTLSKRRRKRTIPQNDWYWAAIVPAFAEHWGYEKREHEKAHESLKFEFLRVRDQNGRERVRSTTELTTKEFSDYCEECRRFAATEYDMYIPDPGEYV